MVARGTRGGARGAWSVPDTCVRVDTLLSQPMLEAAVVVRVRADQPPTEAALILESMLEDARLHILEQWRKLK